MYQYLDAPLVRAPAWDIGRLGLTWPDLSSPEVTAASWREWLDQAWQVPELATAVEAASPGLAREVARILSADDPPDAMVLRAVLSVFRYLLRGTSRATPFGLLAGVAPASIGPRARIRVGSAHQPTARADATWITGLIEMLEADAELRPHLLVAASGLAVARGEYLVIGHRPGPAAGTAPERVQVRASRPVLAALEAARSPIRVADLTAKLAAGFPEASSDAADRLVTQMVTQRLLITSLRARATEPDPLTWLLAELAAVLPHSHPRMAGLRAASVSLARHDSAPSPIAALAERHRAVGAMTGLAPSSRPMLAIDLRLDWELTVPDAVAAEAARAAGVLTRLARHRVLNRGWRAWHGRFLDRYGPGAVVKVLDATDDAAGLGFPAGYLGSPYPWPQDSPVASRDKVLLRLAQRAMMRRENEIVLDDALIAKLAAAGPGDPAQPSTEVTVRVHAGSIPDLDAGRFTLHVTGVSRGTGTIAGRFLHLLDEPDRERMLAAYRTLPGGYQGSLLAHLSGAPLYPRAENIARVPQAAELLISVGEHPAAGAAGQVPVSDLAVTADARTLHLVSLSRQQPVHTILPSAVDMTIHTHPLVRFLLEAPVALAAPCAAFDWAAASALPVLPAIRYGKTVLSPARWHLTADSLPGKHEAWSGWDAALTDWANLTGLPRHVEAGDGDQRITLDLAEPSHRVLLRAEINRAGHATFRTAPGPGDLGWADGHPHEITIPLAATDPPSRPVRWSREVTTRRHGHLPGCGRRLYLQLYAPRDLQDTILTRHVPDLAARLGSQVRWWFIRYDNPGPHLRLRLLLPGDCSLGDAAGHAGAWASDLRDRGLITRVTWDTDYPETARFGGTTAMDDAEAFFATDSAAAAVQVAASAGKNGPSASALTAASMADIASGVTADDATGMRWLTRHITTSPVSPPRAVYDHAVALISDQRALLADGIAQAWRARRAAIAAYRARLEQAGGVALTELLPDLLHLHHTRIAGPDLAAERACLHLARAGALSWLARSGTETT
jgi:lantibiotic biosynthesis protein